MHDGNGWVRCRCGDRHWGLHGAAGLLLVRTDPAGNPDPTSAELLLQLRAAWTHQGGSWGLPGGARDSHETAVTAALREAREEAGVESSALDVVGERLGVDHGDWSYTYVIGLARPGVRLAGNDESDELRWVAPVDVAALALHPGLASAWPGLAGDLSAALATRPSDGTVRSRGRAG